MSGHYIVIILYNVISYDIMYTTIKIMLATARDYITDGQGLGGVEEVAVEHHLNGGARTRAAQTVAMGTINAYTC